MAVKLLERSSRRVVLTKEGKALIPRVKSLLAKAEHLLEAAQSTKTLPRGDVRMAITPAFGEFILPHLAPRLLAEYPDIRLIVEPTYDLADLQNPNYDFAIRVGQVMDENLVARKIAGFRRILVASPEFAAQYQVNSPQDLANSPCLVFNGNAAQSQWKFENATDKITVEIDARLAAKSFSMLSALAEQGFGYAYVTDFWVAEALKTGKLVRCLPDFHSETSDILLAYRFGAQKISRVSATLDVAQKVTSEILQN